MGPTSELEPAERAQRIERRLAALLDRPTAIAPAAIEDAEEELTTPDELASRWAAAIDEALARGRSLRESPLGRASAVRHAILVSLTERGFPLPDRGAIRLVDQGHALTDHRSHETPRPEGQGRT